MFFTFFIIIFANVVWKQPSKKLLKNLYSARLPAQSLGVFALKKLMIKLLKLDATFESGDYLERNINIFLDEIRKEHHIYNTEIKIDCGFLFVIVSYSSGKMVY